MLAVIAGHEAVARELAVAGANLRLVGSGAPEFSLTRDIVEGRALWLQAVLRRT